LKKLPDILIHHPPTMAHGQEMDLHLFCFDAKGSFLGGKITENGGIDESM